MAYRPGPDSDPAMSDRANFDYTSDTVERPELAADLDALVDGDVRMDSYSRQLYATDGSEHEVLPIGVVRPVSTKDVENVLEYCYDNELPVLPRGGATSLAGQTTNEAIVLDFKAHMNDFLGFDEDAEVARAQPGITLAELDHHLEDAGLHFAPDPAWGDKSVLGGCIGNNSTGSHSLQYGMTDAYTESLEVVLADGTVTQFGWMDLDELETAADPEGDLEERFYDEILRVLDEDADDIHEKYPDLKRNVSGYAYDRLLEEAEERGEVNVARLFAGSEGTLGVITEAEVSLEPLPEETSIAMLAYENAQDAMRDVSPILEHDPAAVEVMDDVFLDLARDTEKFSELVGILPDGTDSTLLVEFFAEDEQEAKQKVADLVADRVPGGETELEPTDGASSATGGETFAFEALEAYTEERKADFWEMRKAGLPILLSRTGDERHRSFIEDTAVPAENLPEFVSDFRDILDDHDTFATYYAHAGPGVLHIRPLLNLKTEKGVAAMESIAEQVTDLVIQYDGSVSGEHGDGRARTQWNKKFYGEDLWESFRSLKESVDPKWLLNPGQVCGYEDGPTDLTEDLRYGPDYDFEVPFEPALHWENDNGFQGMTELCHGCGGCTGYQDTTGGTMCPTYRAAEEEIMSTRGRANMLRSAMNGNLPDDLLSEEFIHEVLDLCMSCKGCKIDCPSGVDMAKLKAEVEWEYKQRNGASLRDKLFANVEDLLELGSTFSPLSNWAKDLPGAKLVQERGLGIARERDLPDFKSTTVQDWFEQRGGSAVPRSSAERTAVFIADPYTNYMYTDRGKAAIRVLEAAGVHVEVSEEVTDTGRPAYSKALIGQARETARSTVDSLAPRVESGWDVVSVEPSSSVMIQEDYLDLLSGEDVEAVSENTYSVFEYLDAFGLDENLEIAETGDPFTYHGNCMHKGTNREHHVTQVMERLGFDVDQLDSTCCGMAGSFGYEKEHYSVSKSLMGILEDQIHDSPGEDVVVTGASCTMQVGDMPSQSGKPDHAVKRLDAAIK
ncbi:MAG: FAD-binding and (Fe-S)-binding domain-containing protein [Halodesulfurarchaeum sp.]